VDIYLHKQQGTSDKVYSLHVRQTTVGLWVGLGFWGRRGAKLRTRGSCGIFTSQYAAESYVDQKAQEKRSEGYFDVPQSVVWPGLISPLIAASVVDHATAYGVVNGAAAPPLIHRPATPPPPRTTAKASTRGAKANAPAIPAWILACMDELPAPLRPRAVDILADAFPAERPLILAGSKKPQAQPVDWMRAIFARLPHDDRRAIYRRFSMVLHPDQGGDDAVMARWNATYRRFAPN
jgi:predicted DNA-binding WGR domain protein